MTKPEEKNKDDKAPPTPPTEETAEQKAYKAWQAAKAESESGPQKEQFHRWLDEWADKRAKAAPKPKTPTGEQRPRSFFENLFGDGA